MPAPRSTNSPGEPYRSGAQPRRSGSRRRVKKPTWKQTLVVVLLLIPLLVVLFNGLVMIYRDQVEKPLDPNAQPKRQSLPFKSTTTIIMPE